MSHKRQPGARCWSNFLGVGGLLIYKLLDDEESNSSDLDKYIRFSCMRDELGLVCLNFLVKQLLERKKAVSSNHIQALFSRIIIKSKTHDFVVIY